MSQVPFFVLVIAGTELIKYPGISAAGANQDELAYTATLDAEFMYHGKTISKPSLPISPDGICSPALVSKAISKLLQGKVLVVNAGAHIRPQCPCFNIYSKPSGDISQGKSLELEIVETLYEQGQKIFGRITKKHSNHDFIIGESVVSGTTTAFGVLSALGYSCQGLVSSSLPQGNHKLKQELISQGLKQTTTKPLEAISLMGDAMQAIVCGIAVAAIDSGKTITLAGGSQMLAVKALIDKLSSEADRYIQLSPSPWVVEDSSSNFNKLLQLVSPGSKLTKPINKIERELLVKNSELDTLVRELSTNSLGQELDLQSIFANYDRGYVKEGAGMGGLMSKAVEVLAQGCLE